MVIIQVLEVVLVVVVVVVLVEVVSLTKVMEGVVVLKVNFIGVGEQDYLMCLKINANSICRFGIPLALYYGTYWTTLLQC